MISVELQKTGSQITTGGGSIVDRLTIYVFEEIGQNCMTIADGKRIYDLVNPVLGVGGLVALDFFGVEVFTSSFFCFAIGQLLRDYQPEFLNRALAIENLNCVGQQTLEDAIENSSRYYFNLKAREGERNAS
jgi:hypothetical protein